MEKADTFQEGFFEDWLSEKGIGKTSLPNNNAGLTALAMADFLEPAVINYRDGHVRQGDEALAMQN